MGNLAQLWQRALEPTSPRKLRSILAGLKPTAYERSELTAQLVGPVGNLVETNRAEIEDLLSTIAGQPVRLKLDEQAQDATDKPTTPARPADDDPRPPAGPVATPAEVANDPVVAKAVELFGARDIRVVPKKRVPNEHPGG